MHSRLSIWALALMLMLTASLSACGGGGGGNPLTLTSVGGPAGVPVSIASTVPVAGSRLLEGGLRLYVVGVGDFPCTPTSNTTAVVAFGAFAVPPGRYDVYLATPERFTPTLVDGLIVNAQPVLTACTPNAFDANFNVPFRIVGTGLIGPLSARFLDAAGQQVGPAIPMSLEPGEASATAVSPILPAFSGSMSGSVQITSADGQAAMAGMPITVSCLRCEARAIDAAGNNLSNPTWGAAGMALRRAVAPAYADGLSQPAGPTRPNARRISNAVCAQATRPVNSVGATDMFWVWGQFVDHDIDLSEGTNPAEAFDIPVPVPDPLFDPLNSGTAVIPLTRSGFDPTTGLTNARQQLSSITAFLDGSTVYGSDAARAAALRTLDGTGRMRTSPGDMPPFNLDGFPNAGIGGDPTALFLCGDIRANEQVGLTSLHTLFLREHNRLADQLRVMNPHLTGDEVYEAARRWVGALIQVITYREFLPVLLGPGTLSAYAGYQPTVDPTIDNVFSTASYRFGHSLVSDSIRRLDAALVPIPEGDLPLRDAFFSPAVITTAGGIDPILRGVALSGAEELDTMIVDDLRNFLFGAPGAGGLDLAALNIQRGRDHGLADYNTVRSAFGLPTQATLSDVTSDVSLRARLSATYTGGPNQLDAWIGGLAEDKQPGALVGELLVAVFKSQFERLRDGDRFWYEVVFTGEALTTLESTTLADVIRRNTTIGGELPDNVFRLTTP